MIKFSSDSSQFKGLGFLQPNQKNKSIQTFI